MLMFRFGSGERMCDGVSRRAFLQLGALGIGGFTLADLLRAEAAQGIGSSPRAVINIHMGGGPSHQDIFDLKPDAPMEYRGEFSPIATNVPGIEICELLPQLAQRADRFALIRSLVGSNAGHSNFQTHTGYNQKSLPNIGGRPSIGAVASRVCGSGAGAPPWISYNGGSAGYLGPTFKPYEPGSSAGGLTLSSGMTAQRLADRTNLLQQIDGLRRDMDASGQMAALDNYTQTAAEIVTSGRVAEALDLKLEDPETIRRYGKKSESLLRARRLVQAGVRVITMNAPWGGWDTHSGNFTKLRSSLPELDQGLSALIDDLVQFDMYHDVVVVMWGEFGRTPRVNKNAGRDHWPPLSMAFLAGGRLQMGQVIGASDRTAAYAQDRPVDYQEVMATLYHHLGINCETLTFTDPNGRPQYLLDHRAPIRELV